VEFRVLQTYEIALERCGFLILGQAASVAADILRWLNVGTASRIVSEQFPAPYQSLFAA
jgi:hypothetical protein